MSNVKTKMYLHWDVNCHYRGSIYDDELLQSVRLNYEGLLQENFEMFSADGSGIVNNQPVWDMKECMTDMSIVHEIPQEHHSCGKWQMEAAAWYCPAHSYSSKEYGIHISKRGIAHLSKQVHDLCPDEPLEIVQMAAIHKLFAHEMCHAWIEDICCMFDFSKGEKCAPSTRLYSQMNRRYNGYIFMEEAICNTVAYGSLFGFLNFKETQEHGCPVFNAKPILNAFERVMRTQPKGYRDFLAIKGVPHKNKLFLQNLERLLSDIYGVDSKGMHATPFPFRHHFGPIPQYRLIMWDLFGVYYNDEFQRICLRKNHETHWANNPPVHSEP